MRGPGHVIHFSILHPLDFSGMAEDRIVKLYARIGPRSISLVMTNCPQVGVVKADYVTP